VEGGVGVACAERVEGAGERCIERDVRALKKVSGGLIK
jgi:hypothetical protein